MNAAHSPPPPMPGAIWLIRRELLRFVRQRSRIVGALGTPVIVWILLASGFAGSFAWTGSETGTLPYSAFLLPGIASMVVLFTAVFAAISLIDDRHAGFLQSVLVSPAPGWSVVAGKVGACALLGTAQAALILLAAPLTGLTLSPGGFLLALAALAAVGAGVSGIGIAAAWRIDSVAGFHGVMNLLLMPMWLLSGAFFPIDGAAGWLAWVMRINPLSWPTEAMRHALGAGASLPPTWAWIGAVAFGAAGIALATAAMARPTHR